MKVTALVLRLVAIASTSCVGPRLPSELLEQLVGVHSKYDATARPNLARHARLLASGTEATPIVADEVKVSLSLDKLMAVDPKQHTVTTKVKLRAVWQDVCKKVSISGPFMFICRSNSEIQFAIFEC